MATKKDKESFNYVAQLNNVNESSTKNKFIQAKWLRDYEPLCNEYKLRHEEMKKLCEEKNACVLEIHERRDDRTVLPFPETTNGMYGWLAAKNGFNLEILGPYKTGSKNPLEEIILLPGNIPRLAPGRSFI